VENRDKEANVFEHLDTPMEAFNYKLGAALEMEKTVCDILGDSIDHAQTDEVRQMLRHHLDETKGHIDTLEQVFTAMQWDIDDSSCPAIDGLKAEGKAMMKKTDDSLMDAIILQSCAEVEHHEIGVYENLMGSARAMGRDDVVDLLGRNCRNEEQTLRMVMQAQEQMLPALVQHAT
jgi:ferritin-like metal-binding protein YciE